MMRWGVLLIGLCPALAFAQSAETFDYTVEDGDTCVKISERFFGDRNRYDLIHAHNPGMGPPPHDLQPGTVLRLPKIQVDVASLPDAHVTDVRRDVQAAEPAGASWRRAERGLGLFGGWRVNTLERSAAELTFRDTSVIQMRQNTLVVIFGGTAGVARRQSSRAELRNGTLRSRLGTLRMAVDTPAGRASLAGGSTVVGVDGEQTARVSHHEGPPATLEGEAGGRVRIPAGRGSKVARHGRPTPPRPLPAAPSWGDTPRAFAGIAGDGAFVHGQWEPVEGARLYRVELLSAATVFAAVEVPAEVTRFELHGVPAGEYAIRVATMDADFFESRPSEPLPISVTRIDVRSPGASQIDTRPLPDPSEHASEPEVGLGSDLVPPEGVVCRREAGGPTVTRLSEPGPLTLHCEAGETALAPLRLTVTSAAIATSGGSQELPSAFGTAAPDVAPDVPAAPPRRPYRQLAMATVRHPSVLALRDPAPDSRLTAVAALALTHEDDADNRVGAGFLLDLALAERVRIHLGYSQSFEDPAPEVPRFFAGLGGVLLDSTVALRAELGAWWPLRGEGGVVLAPAVDLGVEPIDQRLYVRTRQGALLDTSGDGILAWGSAYGVDVWLGGAVSLGVELDMAIGRDRAADELLTNLALGIVLSHHQGPVALSAMLQRSLTRDYERTRGPWRVQLMLAVALDRAD